MIAVVFSRLLFNLRVSDAHNSVYDFWKPLDNLGHGTDHRLKSLAWIDQAERADYLTPGKSNQTLDIASRSKALRVHRGESHARQCPLLGKLTEVVLTPSRSSR